MKTKTNHSALPIPVLPIDEVPPPAGELLASARGKFGFVPNLLGAMANAPALLGGYLALADAFDKTSLSATERQIVLLATSFENCCEYCMAAHSAVAGMLMVDPDVIASLRDDRPLVEPRLQALRDFAAEMVRTRGWPPSEVTTRFLAVGYSPAQALEVVLGIGLKTLSNYCNHLAATPVDPAFEPARWRSPSARC